MFFSDRRVVFAATVIVGFATAARPATAAPLDDPFVGGLSFTGPTSGNLAAVYWNPAALGLVRGFQIMVGGTAHLSTIDVQRASIDPASGMPGGPQATGDATAEGFARPSLFGPRSYLAISSDLGGDRFTLAFATYMPWVEQVSYPLSPTGAGDEPTRYHALQVDLRNLALVPALAIRFGNELRVGLAPGFMFSTGQVSFAEDLALNGGAAGLAATTCNGVTCGAENPQAAARFNVASGHGLGDAKFSVTLGGGIYWRRRNLELGLAYQSRPIGSDRGVGVSGQRSSGTLPPRDGGGPVTCAGGQTDRCLFGDLSYKLPDVFIAGATLRLSPGLELSATVRWLWMHLHDRIDVRLFGPQLDSAGLPQHIVFHRGFRDVWDTRVRVSYWWREQIRIGAAMRVETSAVPTDAVNPAAVDALKLQPMVLIEIRIARRIWLSGGYGVTFMPSVNVTNSVFKPEYASDCVDSGGNLATEACQARLAGRARPTANGRYTATRQDFGITLTARF